MARVRFTKRQIAQRRAMVMDIRSRGIMSLTEIRARLIEKSAGLFEVTTRTISKDIRACLEEVADRFVESTATARLEQIAGYRAQMRRIESMLDDEDEGIRMAAGREWRALMARIDKVAGVEMSNQKIEADVRTGPRLEDLIEAGKRAEAND